MCSILRLAVLACLITPGARAISNGVSLKPTASFRKAALSLVEKDKCIATKPKEGEVSAEKEKECKAIKNEKDCKAKDGCEVPKDEKSSGVRHCLGNVSTT